MAWLVSWRADVVEQMRGGKELGEVSLLLSLEVWSIIRLFGADICGPCVDRAFEVEPGVGTSGQILVPLDGGEVQIDIVARGDSHQGDIDRWRAQAIVLQADPLQVDHGAEVTHLGGVEQARAAASAVTCEDDLFGVDALIVGALGVLVSREHVLDHGALLASAVANIFTIPAHTVPARRVHARHHKPPARPVIVQRVVAIEDLADAVMVGVREHNQWKWSRGDLGGVILGR